MATEIIVIGISFLALLGGLIAFAVKFSRDYGKLEEKTDKNEENIKDNAHNTGELWNAFRGQVNTCNGQRSDLLVVMSKLETTVEVLVESTKSVQKLLQGVLEEMSYLRGERNAK